MKTRTSHLHPAGENDMTKAQEKDLFTKWARYGPQEQKKMIDEYISISAGLCSRDRFLHFLKDKIQIHRHSHSCPGKKAAI
jgi:hypothetical protein